MRRRPSFVVLVISALVGLGVSAAIAAAQSGGTAPTATSSKGQHSQLASLSVTSGPTTTEVPDTEGTDAPEADVTEPPETTTTGVGVTTTEAQGENENENENDANEPAEVGTAGDHDGQEDVAEPDDHETGTTLAGVTTTTEGHDSSEPRDASGETDGAATNDGSTSSGGD